MSEEPPTPRFDSERARVEATSVAAGNSRVKLTRSASQSGPAQDRPVLRRDLSNISGKNEFLEMKASAQLQQSRQAELESRVKSLQRQLDEAVAEKRAVEEQNRKMSSKLQLLDKQYRRQLDESEPPSNRQTPQLSPDAVSQTERSANVFLDSKAEILPHWAPAAQQKSEEIIQALEDFQTACELRMERSATVPAPIRVLLRDYQAHIARLTETLEEQNNLVERLFASIVTMKVDQLYADELAQKSFCFEAEESHQRDSINRLLPATGENRVALVPQQRRPLEPYSGQSPPLQQAERESKPLLQLQAVLCQNEKLTEVAQKIKELYTHLQRRCFQLKFVKRLMGAWADGAEVVIGGGEVLPLPLPPGEEARLSVFATQCQQRLVALQSLIARRIEQAELTAENTLLRRLLDVTGRVGVLDEGVRRQLETELGRRSEKQTSADVVDKLFGLLGQRLGQRLGREEGLLGGYEQMSKSLINEERRAQTFKARLQECFSRLAGSSAEAEDLLSARNASLRVKELIGNVEELRSADNTTLCIETRELSLRIATMLKRICVSSSHCGPDDVRSFRLSLLQLLQGLKTVQKSFTTSGNATADFFSLEVFALALFADLLQDTVRGR